jgi:hypothetical protein
MEYYSVECECLYDEDGEVEEWCDVCMYGPKRAAHYKQREEENRVAAEKIQDELTTRELQYLVDVFHSSETVEERLEVLQQVLRCLWTKLAYLARRPSLLDTVRQKCAEWMDEPAAAPVQGTLIMTIEILSHL